MARIEIPTALTRSTIATDIDAATLSSLNSRIVTVLADEPNLATGAARGAMTRTLAHVFSNPRATKAQLGTLGAILPGDPNPLFPLIVDMALDGQRVERRRKGPNELSVIRGVDNPEWLTLSNLTLIVAAGGEVYHEPPIDNHDTMYWWCKVDDPAANLPVFMRPPQAWGDLPKVTSEAGDDYVLLQQGGDLLPASRVVQLWVMQNKVILTNAEIQAILPQPELP